MGPGALVLLRHGESTWNARNLFTGWHDVPLSERGVAEARQAGETMRAAGLRVDLAVTSLLARATETNRLALEALGQPVVPIVADWRLNERHYGALQGLDKRETVARHGAEQTERWRRSYDEPPPPVDAASPEHPANDPRYAHVPRASLPAAECLRDVVVRVVACVEELVMPHVRAGRTVLVTAHGNSLRALAMHLEAMSPEQVAGFNIPTGVPRRYRIRAAGVGGRLEVAVVEYLGDADAIAAATSAVRRQTGGA